MEYPFSTNLESALEKQVFQEYQTRSNDYESKYAGLHFFDSFQKAFEAWKEDPSIEKISWSENEGTENEKFHRFRPKEKGNRWSVESEQNLCSMSEKYNNASNKEIFWVDQDVMETTKFYEVLTVEEFKAKYGSH